MGVYFYGLMCLTEYHQPLNLTDGGNVNGQMIEGNRASFWSLYLKEFSP